MFNKKKTKKTTIEKQVFSAISQSSSENSWDRTLLLVKLYVEQFLKRIQRKISGWKSCFDKVADSNNSQGSQEYICARALCQMQGKTLVLVFGF